MTEDILEETADEERAAAMVISDMLATALLAAALHEKPPRTFLYCWERDGLRWLIRFKERRPEESRGSAWTGDFIDLNRDAILSDDGGVRMNFNLRAARLAKEKAAQ
jgi:hypothetical protein